MRLIWMILAGAAIILLALFLAAATAQTWSECCNASGWAAMYWGLLCLSLGAMTLLMCFIVGKATEEAFKCST